MRPQANQPRNQHEWHRCIRPIQCKSTFLEVHIGAVRLSALCNLLLLTRAFGSNHFWVTMRFSAATFRAANWPSGVTELLYGMVTLPYLEAVKVKVAIFLLSMVLPSSFKVFGQDDVSVVSHRLPEFHRTELWKLRFASLHKKDQKGRSAQQKTKPTNKKSQWQLIRLNEPGVYLNLASLWESSTCGLPKSSPSPP